MTLNVQKRRPSHNASDMKSIDQLPLICYGRQLIAAKLMRQNVRFRKQTLSKCQQCPPVSNRQRITSSWSARVPCSGVTGIDGQLDRNLHLESS